MQLIYKIGLGVAFLGIMTLESSARADRVTQIPNGNKFQCANCHVSPGGPRNDFGKTIGQKYLSNGKVVWGAELAALDSDGDGVSNGTELGDPNGTWKSGDPNPGNPNDVFNPGDPASKPTSSVAYDAEELADNLNILSFNLSPNPVISMATVSFEILVPGNVRIELINTNGDIVSILKDSYEKAGLISFSWNGSDGNGNSLPSGIYLMRLNFDNVAVIRKAIINR